VSFCAAAACASGRPAFRASEAWSITVLGDTADSRFVAVEEAVSFWNGELAAIGAGVRFVAIRSSIQRLPESVLQQLSEGVRARARLRRPEQLDTIPGDVVVALASSDLTSVGIDPRRFGRALVVLRPGNVPPLSLPNVARNVAAHELGHVLGLQHNDQPGTLMCAPPAPCRPNMWRSDQVRFFPLTEAEKALLLRRWRATSGMSIIPSWRSAS